MKKIKASIIVLLLFFSCMDKNDRATTVEDNTSINSSNEIESTRAGNVDDLHQLAIKVFGYMDPYDFDIQTGSLFLLEDDFSAADKKIIKEISVYDDYVLLRSRNVYSHGLVEKEFSQYNEGIVDNTYYCEYDKDNKIIKASIWEYVYADDFDVKKNFYTRKVYCDGDYNRSETIEFVERGYKLIAEFFNGFRKERHYNQENGLLVEVIGYDRDGFMWEQFTFEYDENNLIQRVSYFVRDKIRYIENVTKRDGLCIAEFEIIFYDENGKNEQRYVFEDYDQFNNWTIRKHFAGNELRGTTRREIKYADP